MLDTYKKMIVFLVLFSFNSKGVQAQQKNVFKTKTIKSTMLRVADWQMKHSNNKPLNTWTNATLYAGVYAAYQTTGSNELLDSLMAISERNKWLPGKRYDHADDIAITQLYVDLYRIKKDEGMIRASIDSIQKMMHVPGNEVKKKGIMWWWCDALFMAPPAMAKLSATLHQPEYLIACDTFYRQCYQLLYSQDEHLFSRDASYLLDANGNGKREANGKKIFWSRGNGWVIAGLARLLEEMPIDYAGRDFYVQLYREMATRLIQLQQADGLWRSSLFDPASYPGGEGSGTGFICYALAWGVNHHVLDKKIFIPYIKSSWIGLNTLVNKEGRVGWVQPIGGDPRRNFNEDSWESYGAGAYLLAASEIVKGKIR